MRETKPATAPYMHAYCIYRIKTEPRNIDTAWVYVWIACMHRWLNNITGMRYVIGVEKCSVLWCSITIAHTHSMEWWSHAWCYSSYLRCTSDCMDFFWKDQEQARRDVTAYIWVHNFKSAACLYTCGKSDHWNGYLPGIRFCIEKRNKNVFEIWKYYMIQFN